MDEGWGRTTRVDRGCCQLGKRINKHTFEPPSPLHTLIFLFYVDHSFPFAHSADTSIHSTDVNMPLMQNYQHYINQERSLVPTRHHPYVQVQLNLSTRNIQTHTEGVLKASGPTTTWSLWGFFISYWGLCRLLCQHSCPHVSGPFVCEVLEVIKICFPFSVGEEDPADPLWPLLNPQRFEPVSPFPSLFFGRGVFTFKGAHPILTLMWDLRMA